MGSLRPTDLDVYDAIQLSLTCLSGVDRKLIIPGQKFQEVLKGTGSVAFEGSDVETDSYIFDARSSVGTVRVDPESLRPLPWLTPDGYQVGGALCEVVSPSGKPENEVSPRSVALKQVKRLKEKFGLTIKSAIEAEFMIYEMDGTTPFNNKTQEAYGRFDNMAGKEDNLLDTCYRLEKAGLQLETFMSEFAAGQFEITFRPEEGISSADSIMIMKDGLRVCLGKHNLIPTFMACPNEHGHANGFHLNHSLWSVNNANEFLDLNDAIQLSDIARHWIAGLVLHAPALTALFCPTLNCYIRLIDEMTPKTATWAEENRSCFLRLKTERSNIYLENRLPSSAANPYLALAGTIAAGIDGLERKLACPPQNDQTAPKIPKTLEDATAALENDHDLTKALGEDFVSVFLGITKKSLNEKVDKKLEDLSNQRRIYFQHI